MHHLLYCYNSVVPILYSRLFLMIQQIRIISLNSINQFACPKKMGCVLCEVATEYFLYTGSAKKMYTHFNKRKLRCIIDYCKSTIHFRQHDNMIYVFTSV